MGFLDGSKAELTWIREQRTLCLGVFSPGLLGGHFSPSRHPRRIPRPSAAASWPQTLPL